MESSPPRSRSTWVSESQVSAIDPATGRFAYRSQSDDGNPSYVDWEWHVDAEGDGSIVDLTGRSQPDHVLAQAPPRQDPPTSAPQRDASLARGPGRRSLRLTSHRAPSHRAMTWVGASHS